MYDEYRLNFGAFTGIDQSVDPSFLYKGSSPDACNMDTTGGVLSTSKGMYKVLGPMTGNILGIGSFYKNIDGVYGQQIIMLCSDGAYWQTTDGLFARLPGSPNFQSHLSCVNYQYNDTALLIVAEPGKAPVKFDGIAFSYLGANVPKFKYLTLHYERLWGAGVAENPDKVYYSNEFHPESWTMQGLTGEIDLPTWNGGSVIGLCVMFDEVVVFKQNDIFRISGSSPGNYSVTRVAGVVGPISERTIASAGDAAYFISEEGMCVYDGVRARPLNDGKLMKFMETVITWHTNVACGVIYDGKYYAAVPTNNMYQNDAVIEYNLKTGDYMIRKGIEVSCFEVVKNRLLFADYSGNIFDYTAGSYETGMESYWKTPVFDLGCKNAKKSAKAFYASVKGSGKLEIETIFDGRSKVRRFNLPLTLKNVRYPLRGRGRRFQFVFRNVNGSDFELHSPQIVVELDED